MRIILSVLFLFATTEIKCGTTTFSDAIYCRPYSRLINSSNFMDQSSLPSTVVSGDVLLSHIPLSNDEVDRNIQKIKDLSELDIVDDPYISIEYIEPLLRILGQTQLYSLISFDGIDLIATIMVPVLQTFKEANHRNQFFMVKQILPYKRKDDTSSEYFLYHPFNNNIFDDCIDATEIYLMTFSMEMENFKPGELYSSEVLMDAFEKFNDRTYDLIRALKIRLLYSKKS